MITYAIQAVWANWDSAKSEVIAVGLSLDEATDHAERLRAGSHCVGYVVKNDHGATVGDTGYRTLGSPERR